MVRSRARYGSRIVDLDTADVHVGKAPAHTRTGSGAQPIVFAHGITDSGACWSCSAQARFPRPRSGDVRRPGTRRIRVGGDIHVRRSRRRPHRATRRAPVAAVVLIGHSMGGAHVAAVAAGADTSPRARTSMAGEPCSPTSPAPRFSSLLMRPSTTTSPCETPSTCAPCRGRARPRCRAQHPS